MLRSTAARAAFLALTLAAVASTLHADRAFARADNPDYRVRATFRTPQNGQWGANESVGNADFRVQSRFLQVYYGGVARSDEFKFSVQVDFTGISGFDTEFAGSPYNSDYDVWIDDTYVGRAVMGILTPGIAEFGYDSRHPELPDLPLPAAFPSPVDVGAVVRVFFATGTAPAIGSPLPEGTPLFQSVIVEKDRRGDTNADGKVDLIDFAVLQTEFDPSNARGPHVGPAAGDFTGDNRSDAADYNTFAANWTERGPVPALAIAGVGPQDASGTLRLGANQPNPFRAGTVIPFALGRASDVTFEVFDLTGQRVARREQQGLAAGSHVFEFDGLDRTGRPLPAGAYFYRVRTNDGSLTRRMLRVR